MKEQELSSKKRVEWIDVLRGILIILMVLGHATGKFNGYIYQFHMAAFFLLSGYTADLRRKSIANIAYSRAKRLLLPYVTTFFLLLFVSVFLNKFGLYSIIFGMEMPDVGLTISEFFIKGKCYVWWLGAAWFLWVLFVASIIAKLLHKLCGKMFLIPSIALYLLAYYLISNGVKPARDVNLALIGQFFYCVGYFINDNQLIGKLDNSEKKYAVYIVAFVASVVCCCFCKYYLKYTVDYPSEHFNSPIPDFYMGICGCFICFCIARAIENTLAKKIFSFVGKNTIGIVLFHFMYMKLALVILYLFKVIPIDELASIVPSTATGNAWYVYIVIFSVSLSIITYMSLCSTPGLRILLGQGNDIMKFKPEAAQIRSEYTQRHCVLMKAGVDPKKKNRIFLVLAATIGFTCVSYYHMIPRIMCNDELQSRFWYLSGPVAFFKHYTETYLAGGGGRMLSCISGAVNMYIGFIGSRIDFLKVSQWIVIVFDVVLVSVLLYQITSNRLYISLFFVFSILFLPITFEHTIPNAFSALIGVPLACLVGSIILFNQHLSNASNKKTFGLTILLLYALTSYEVFVTFVPVYILLSYRVSDRKDSITGRMINAVKRSSMPICIGIGYLAIYLVLSKAYPSNYPGNRIGFSFAGALGILSQLFKSSFPGYYLINNKYQYLTYIYGSDKGVLGTVQPMHFILLSVVIIFTVLLMNRNETNNKCYGLLWTGVVILLYSFLPALPNCISSMYQGVVNSNDMIALPVSFIIYLMIMAALCSILSLLLQSKCFYGIKLVTIIVICVGGILVQLDNRIFTLEQHNNYLRMQEIEQLIESKYFVTLVGKKIYAPDLYQQMNALYIQEDYWTSFAQKKGIDVQISGVDQNADVTIEYIDDEYFVISDRNNEQQTVVICNANIRSRNAGFQLNAQEIEMETTEETHAGNTLETCLKKDGVYEDGWFAPHTNLVIHSGNEGIIHLEGYYPFEIENNQVISVYIEDQLNCEYLLTGAEIVFDIPVQPDSDCDLTFISNFEYTAETSDRRTLAYIVNLLSGR